ncbi:response regulator [Paraburkholderia fungorum]|uniref:response regulator n=1 Tax=Paraburkholderia fungorum TaxID=134537 RepID=UPI0038B7993B
MQRMPVHEIAAMRSLPFSNPPDHFNRRQIALFGAPARVLVVDDSRPNAEALVASLSIDGLEARFALSGPEALQQLNSWLPHVFVLDINMPIHNGFAVARVLRRMLTTRDTGIIAFTALGKADFAAAGPVVDFDAYCQKGGTQAPLLKIINDMLT